MSYEIVLSKIAADKIRSFRPDLFPDVTEELDRLGANPRLGVRVPHGPLAGRMLFSFRVMRPPLVFRFAVLYQFTPDERSIEIADFGRLEGEPPRLVD